jgi:hypothetical protein
MPKEIFPSAYECDCGHRSDFFENTIREIKAMSRKKKIYLGDSDRRAHHRLSQRREDNGKQQGHGSGLDYEL